MALSSSFRCHAQASEPAPATSLEDLEKATSLDYDGAKPWHLKMSFELMSLDGKPEDKGTVEVRWMDSRHVSTDVESAKLHGPLPDEDAAFAAGTSREVFLVQELLQQFDHPVHAVSGKRVSENTKKVGALSFTCLTAVPGAPGALSPALGPVFCVEPGASRALRIVSGNGMEATRNRVGKFVGINLALEIAINYLGKTAIHGHAESLETFVPSAAERPSDEPPPAAPTSQVQSGVKLRGLQPAYPEGARVEHRSGVVILAVMIDKGGRTKDVAAIAATDPMFVEASVAAVRTWTYKPYLLNGDASEVSTTVSVNYNMQQ